MNHEENMVDEAMRTFKYIATAAGGEIDLLYALALLRQRAGEEIDAVLDNMNGQDDADNE